MTSQALLHNPRAARIPYPDELRHLLSIGRATQSWQCISNWPRVRADSPLYEQPTLAAELELARVFVKDESARSPLGSFKALGAPIALVRQLCRLLPGLDEDRVLLGEYRDLLKQITVICATDGNHGRALAAGAYDAGCRCVIVLHAQVGEERERAIAEYGARILRIEGNYDHSVAEAASLASAQGWYVISDTSYEGYETIPRDVMQGYAILVAEAVEQSKLDGGQSPWTHVMLQGGVGGLAAGVMSYLWERFGANRPYAIVVEPVQADCLYQSAMAGSASPASGTVDSVMAGLACGMPSPLAWRFLQPSVDAFLRIRDADAISAMRRLARAGVQDHPVVAGESGAAGLAGLLYLLEHHRGAEVGLDRHSSVLIINSEGATSPSLYHQLVGESADSVLDRQRAFSSRRQLDVPDSPARSRR